MYGSYVDSGVRAVFPTVHAGMGMPKLSLASVTSDDPLSFRKPATGQVGCLSSLGHTELLKAASQAVYPVTGSQWRVECPFYIMYLF